MRALLVKNYGKSSVTMRVTGIVVSVFFYLSAGRKFVFLSLFLQLPKSALIVLFFVLNFDIRLNALRRETSAETDILGLKTKGCSQLEEKER